MRSANRQIAAAVATALAAVGVSSVAHALDAATTAAIPADHKFIMGGASAQRDAVEAALRDTLCVTGTFTRYRVNASNSPDLRAYSCTLKSTAVNNPALQGDNVVYYYRSEGGSIYGPGSIAKNVAIARLDVSTACTAVDGSSGFFCNVSGYALSDDGLSATGNITRSQLNMGTSDLEPAMFTGPNWPNPSDSVLGDEPAPGVLASLPAVPVLGQAFGVLVRSDMTAINNLTRQDIAGIFTGNYGDWSQIKNSGTTGTITVCRRERGSGTQTSAALYFLGQGCSAAAPAFIHSIDNPPLSSVVIENSTSSAVAACMTANVGSIGIAVGNAAPAGTKFVTINGSTMSKVNAAAGDYDYWYEATFTKRPGLPTTLGLMADDLIKAAQSDASLPVVNSALALTGIGGNTGTSAPLVAGTTKPISLGRRGGNSGNSCAPVVPQNVN